eukprot:m51a1_g1398 hypothetical protein (307) ;mRNA; f:487569-488788
MDSPHSRVVPDALHTLDDLVFAAFQGPVLSLSSRVLHQYRAFAALLLLRTRWRTDRGLSRADVAAALVHARCCVPGTLVAAECSKCGGVLDVAESEAEEQRLRRELPAGVEVYAATLRTRCTSSRKHVGSAMLVLAVELGPGAVVVSERFAIYARHAARHLATLQQRLSPPGDASPSGSSSDEFMVMGPLLAGSPLGPELRALGSTGMAIGVRINIVRFTQEEQQQIACAIVPLLRANVPGYLVHKTSMTPASLVIIVVGTSTPDALLLVNSYGVQFTSNQIRNPFNRNLIADGLVQPLLTITNMD